MSLSFQVLAFRYAVELTKLWIGGKAIEINKLWMVYNTKHVQKFSS
jgi:hypothetical protein